MFTNIFIGFVVLFILAATPPVVARERWLERNNRAVLLHPRRFGQEQPGVIQQLSAACPGQVCGNLAVQAVTPLLAAQPECSQQDHADAIIDASRQFDAATQANMVALAKEYRQAEKNTPPDFSTNPPAARNSVFCQKAPKNLELNGLVQAQDPANDADLFFDPSTQATVRKGTQANTAPFSGAAAPRDPPVDAPAPTATTATALPDTAEECVTEVTVTVTGSNPAATGDATTFTVGDPITTAAPQNPTPPTNGSKIGNFGSCSVPQMEFGVGFDGRRETSFQPVDKVSYDHRSAQNHAIITHFICNTLVNKCGADQTARDTCATAKVAAAAAATGTGAQADAFNAVFGITTSFANIASVDNQGNVVSGTDDGRAPSATNGPSSNVASPTSATTVSSSAAATNTAISNGNGGNSGNNSGIGNFGQCSVPEIEFGTGFDGRRETSFQPADKASFNHGSAQNIDIIARAICDTLTSSCRADATVKATCATAAAAASAAPTKTGAQADAFNQVFGINTVRHLPSY
ncbi:hypothetical protein DXG03_001752 [Asterophora parasitica]|uniref:Uncharacterized protein n=1 Tax=Asterophora parasitica TaxID=117018 RepID=A0A9P7G355_9AGAR|nr:hypothetical protein DXG03_001752 [Asterophora parasitica]